MLTDPLTIFSGISNTFRFLMINLWTHIEPSDHQQNSRIFRFLHKVSGILATSFSDTYVKISARSCLKTLGAGGTTAKPRKPPKMIHLRGLRFFNNAPVDPRILGGVAIYVDGSVDGLNRPIFKYVVVNNNCLCLLLDWILIHGRYKVDTRLSLF